jgi:TonB-linked SusC/RagA family outer membrane protein
VITAENCNKIQINNHEIKIKWVNVPDDGNLGEIVLDDLNAIVNTGNTQTTKLNSTFSTVNIDSEEIINNSSFNIKDALLGLSQFSIRGDKYNSLLIVDGFPRSWDYLSKQSIESITILKDAAGKALWGSRGANGVIVVTTKRGKYHTKEIDVEYTHGVGKPVFLPQMADALSYARALNEAHYYDGIGTRYTEEELDFFSSGAGDNDLYPNTNWLDQGLRDNTHNNQLNISIRGGGDNIRYFSSTNYKNNFGIIENSVANFDNRYSSQIRSYTLSTQMNLDINLTKSTQARLNLLGYLSENIGPIKSSDEIFGGLIRVPSASYPIFTSNGNWGGNNIYDSNPIADIAALGLRKTNQRVLQADFTLTQDFSKFLPGLRAEIGIAYDNSVTYAENQVKSYTYEVNEKLGDAKNSMIFGNESNLEYSSSLADQFMQTAIKFKLLYNKSFDHGHSFNISAISGVESLVLLGRNNTWKRQYMLGTLGYDFQNRYLADFVINYYGTSVLTKGNRFNLYPAISTSWILSNEPFFNFNFVNLFKFRLSVGYSGLDNIPYELDKQFWESGSVYYFRESNNAQWGTKEGPLPSPVIKNERSTDGNMGVDLKLIDKITLNLDAFYRRRDNLRVSGSATYSSILGIEVPNVFEGITDVKGGELAVKWEEKIQNFNFYIQGSFNYAQTKIIENNEGFKPYDYLYKKGKAVGQFYGLEAIGYFNDWEDIETSPKQLFSEIRPGDVKYKDQNDDNKIDQDDVVATGYSTYLPEIYYGFRIGFDYKKSFGIDMIWQGVANYSVELNTPSVYWPLRNNTNISNWYLNDRIRWTEETKEIANVPRLSTFDNANNFRSSTQWLEDGSYLSLRNVNIYYNLPLRTITKLKLNEFQIYIRGNNLLMIDKIKYLTSENLNVNYPNLSIIYFGIGIKF